MEILATVFWSSGSINEGGRKLGEHESQRNLVVRFFNDLRH